tara:strand:+ start:715 stop:1581 length:867 start_codon:yes stop_codon:yes gene_type:complete
MNNPLTDYYRQKEIYVTIPTQGRWYKQKPNLTKDGEIGIKPMTISDEVMLNIPDALFNGEAIYNLIQSIAPDIYDPFEISMPDVDVILLASRAATYDKKMQIETRCTHCNTRNEYEIDIPSVLSQVTVVNEQVTLDIKGLIIELKPNTLASINAYNMKSIATSQLLGKLSTNEEEARRQLSDTYFKSVEEITAANIAMISDGIVSVTTPNGDVVNEQSQIIEWLGNSNKDVLEKIETQLRKLNKNGIPSEFDFTCTAEKCGKDFKGAVEFNPAFFFSKNLETLGEMKS